MPISRSGLERNMVENGCAVCAAGHKHDHDTLYFHFRCHPNAPAFLVFDPLGICNIVLQVCVVPDCSGDNGFLVNRAASTLHGKIRPNGMFYQDCHPDSAVYLKYTKGSGVLVAECYECKNVVAEMLLEDQLHGAPSQEADARPPAGQDVGATSVSRG